MTGPVFPDLATLKLAARHVHTLARSGTPITRGNLAAALQATDDALLTELGTALEHTTPENRLVVTHQALKAQLIAELESAGWAILLPDKNEPRTQHTLASVIVGHLTAYMHVHTPPAGTSLTRHLETIAGTPARQQLRRDVAADDVARSLLPPKTTTTSTPASPRNGSPARALNIHHRPGSPRDHGTTETRPDPIVRLNRVTENDLTWIALLAWAEAAHPGLHGLTLNPSTAVIAYTAGLHCTAYAKPADYGTRHIALQPGELRARHQRRDRTPYVHTTTSSDWH